jgi:hypothetical protein
MAQRFVIGIPNTNKFDVLVGVRLNDAPLSQTEAEALARRRTPSSPASAPPPVRFLTDSPGAEPWRDFVETDGSIRTRPRGPWGPV